MLLRRALRDHVAGAPGESGGDDQQQPDERRAHAAQYFVHREHDDACRRDRCTNHIFAVQAVAEERDAEPDREEHL